MALSAPSPHERFRWLTAVRSACIQTSRPHPGHTADLDATFARLFDELVAMPVILPIIPEAVCEP